MSYTSEDWRIAITNLIKKTSKNEIVWENSARFHADAWTEVERSFECIIKDKIYVVSETRKKHYFDETEFYWVEGHDFSIFTNSSFDSVLLASAPESLSIIGNLYEAVKASFAFSSDALGDLLD